MVLYSLYNRFIPFNGIDDDLDFLEVLYEMRDYGDPVSLDTLLRMVRDKVFNPFELNDDDESLPFSQYDPDIQYYNSQINYSLHSCNYYLEDSLNKVLSSIPAGCTYTYV